MSTFNSITSGVAIAGMAAGVFGSCMLTIKSALIGATVPLTMSIAPIYLLGSAILLGVSDVVSCYRYPQRTFIHLESLLCDAVVLIAGVVAIVAATQGLALPVAIVAGCVGFAALVGRMCLINNRFHAMGTL